MKTAITEAEVLQALAEAAREQEDGGLTFEEILARSPWGKDKTRERLKAAVRAGTVTARRSLRPNIVGEWQAIPVYFFPTASATAAAAPRPGAA